MVRDTYASMQSVDVRAPAEPVAQTYVLGCAADAVLGFRVARCVGWLGDECLAVGGVEALRGFLCCG